MCISGKIDGPQGGKIDCMHNYLPSLVFSLMETQWSNSAIINLMSIREKSTSEVLEIVNMPRDPLSHSSVLQE